ncbi:pentapeptide repeat-containing protein [Streptomyces sp. t39]|uniref:pentapeptide repeat-containing protein n=1 Tax=Streptomyces sp. t39 TaxID=1828156 RepID=UPI003967CE90
MRTPLPCRPGSPGGPGWSIAPAGGGRAHAELRPRDAVFFAEDFTVLFAAVLPADEVAVDFLAEDAEDAAAVFFAVLFRAAPVSSFAEDPARRAGPDDPAAFPDAALPDPAAFPEALLPGADFSGADFSGADFSGADFSGAPAFAALPAFAADLPPVGALRPDGRFSGVTSAPPPLSPPRASRAARTLPSRAAIRSMTLPPVSAGPSAPAVSPPPSTFAAIIASTASR